ncbi:hypothetical protein R70331_25940 [Paenibacillus sp. FSL R7-0331]|nr:hypothetical protein R70331_25940 [Paenibacillus sp. FSL R7-0331]
MVTIKVTCAPLPELTAIPVQLPRNPTASPIIPPPDTIAALYTIKTGRNLFLLHINVVCATKSAQIGQKSNFRLF